MSRNESNLNEIPYGNYCYTPVTIEYEKNIPIVKIKKCPYLINQEDGSFKCLLINISSYDDDVFADQVKVCGFNEEDYEFVSEE